MKKLILSILLGMVSQGVSAQMTLNDCLVYARYHAPRNLVNGIEVRLDLETAMRELGAADARVTAEETAYKAVQRKFELGGASAIDLYTSGAKLAAARANREGKRIQKIISRIVLGYYNGEKLIK